jgi:Glycosyltransferase family 87
MRLLATAATAALLSITLPVASAGAASASSQAGSTHTSTLTTSTNSEAPIPVALSTVPPAAHRLSSDQVLAIANRLPKMRPLKHEYHGSFGDVYLKGGFQWQVSYFTHSGQKEIGLVVIDDLSGRVIEQWTGFQVAWSMARGYPGAFGRHVNALYVWLPMCLLFFLPFFNFRKPFSLLHLDLLMLLSFSVSLAFFNHANIWASVPLSYPPLLYLLARMLTLLWRRSRPPSAAKPSPQLRLLIPAPWLALGVVFLIGFRIAFNVTDSNVIDVGYAGVIGASKIVHDKPLYGGYPSDNEHGDTYGPFNYEAYVPFEQIFGWSGTWDDLPASHAAAIVSDLLAMALLFLIGRRMRGPTLGVALAYAWAAYPFTLYDLESNSNDTLVAVLVLAAVLAASYRSKLALGARGGMAALAGLTKFAPLAITPLLATHGLGELSLARRVRAVALYLLAFAGVVALASIPALSHDSLHTIYERTIVYQSKRESPFSAWGLYGWHGAERVVEVAAVLAAVVLAVVRRRSDLVGLTAACAFVILIVEVGLEHWFYLYIPWFFGLVIVALLGALSDPWDPEPAAASAPAQWSQPASAVST